MNKVGNKGRGGDKKEVELGMKREEGDRSR